MQDGERGQVALVARRLGLQEGRGRVWNALHPLAALGLLWSFLLPSCARGRVFADVLTQGTTFSMYAEKVSSSRTFSRCGIRSLTFPPSIMRRRRRASHAAGSDVHGFASEQEWRS